MFFGFKMLLLDEYFNFDLGLARHCFGGSERFDFELERERFCFDFLLLNDGWRFKRFFGF